MQSIYSTIGKNIHNKRKERHMTQEFLAAKIETSAQYVSRIERGQVCSSLEFLYKLADALDCSIYKEYKHLWVESKLQWCYYKLHKQDDLSSIYRVVKGKP